MTSVFTTHLNQQLAALHTLTALEADIKNAGHQNANFLLRGNKVMSCGNGGSAADAQLIAAELDGRFFTERRGLPAMALTIDTSILTVAAYGHGYTKVFVRQFILLMRLLVS